LFKGGTHAYAEDPSTEILAVQWALDDGDPVVVDCTRPGWNSPFNDDYQDLIRVLNDPDVEIVAHNSMFDRTLLRRVWGVEVPVHRWRDTMVKALAHGLPGGLDKIGRVLGLPLDLAKDKRGKELIQLFCKPRPKNQILRRATRETHPKEWREFVQEYGRQDIIAMREVDQRLPAWNYRPGHDELALWHLDQKINDRGFLVDQRLADGAIAAVAREQTRLKAEVAIATGGAVTNVSRRDQLLGYILAEYGVTLPDMKKDTLERRLNDPELPDGVRFLIALRLEATKTGVAKYVALKRAVSKDGRLRNTLQFCGAQRTGRWAGRIFQPQNMMRPDLLAQDIATAILALQHGVAHLFDSDVMRLASNAVRGCIVAPAGKKLCVADLANIEGRGLAFLAGERWKLKAFGAYDEGTGQDMYVMAYARAFNVSPDVVLHDKEFGNGMMRQIGKVMELGLGFGGGVAAFITFAAVYKMDLSVMAEAVWATASREAIENAQGMLAWVKKRKRATFGLTDRVYIACEILKRAWRDAHPNTEALWDAADEAVKKAIWNPGQTFSIGEHLCVRVDGAWLRIRLPSGRYLCYVQPKVSDSGEISYAGINQYTRQWGRVKTYGGKLIENCTQAFARDVLGHNMPAVEAAGYEIVLDVHDELLTETPDTDDFSSDELAAMMSRVPPWATGMPIAAAGFESDRYRKD
jgi:DNA polymerase